MNVSDPVLVLTLGRAPPRSTLTKVRCRECADEPVPVDLLPLPDRAAETVAITETMARLTQTFKGKEYAPLDAKTKQIGDREVGEEG
jgi:hypothetical protein